MGDALIYPGVGNKRVNHEIPANRRDKKPADRGGIGEGGGHTHG